MVALALSVGLLIGVVGVGFWVLGPAGYRPGLALTTPLQTPSLGLPRVSSSPNANPFLPSPRTGAAMAFDAASGKMVLFGGRSDDSSTWTWDGRHWSQVKLTSGPAPRLEANMAYDAVHQAVVLRGGVNGLRETWTWNGTRWLLMSPTVDAPVWSVGGGNQPLAWDAERHLILLYAYTRFPEWGGTDISELNQVWSWDGSTWAQVQTTGDAPANHGMQGAGLAYDSARRQLVFFGHDNTTRAPMTWVLDGATWRVASTSGPGDLWFSLAADDGHSNIVLFGSNGDTWTWDGAKWTAQNPTHAPSPRVGAVMAYDTVRRVVVLFGGGMPSGYFGYSTEPSLNDTWTWNGIDWTRLA